MQLENIGITKIQSSRWQKEASIPKERFEEHIKETKEAEKELTTTGIIRGEIENDLCLRLLKTFDYLTS